MEAKNGRLYVLDGVLTPPSIEPVLPHRCDINETKIIKVSRSLQQSDTRQDPFVLHLTGCR